MIPPEKIVSALKLEGLIEALEGKSDFGTRVHIALRAIEKALPLEIECKDKNLEEANDFRKQGDEIFMKQRGKVPGLLEAWKLYCTSIAKAENSVTLAQAYANRSAALFNLKKYVECLNDINRALDHNYPIHLKPNLLRRKAKCLKILGIEEVDAACEEARSCLENLDISDEKKERLDEKIEIVKNIATQKKEEQEEAKEVALPVFIPNDKIPSASYAVGIKYSKDFGKHLVANRDINVGDIVINEKPFAGYLVSDKTYTHCSHCFLRAWESIPCENCSFVMYCSEKCKNEAWVQYHDIECSMKKYFLALNMHILVPFALKLTVLAIREAGSIQQLSKQLKEIDECKDYLLKCFSGGIYYSDKYRSVYNLVTHESDRKRYDILSLSLNTALTLYFLLNFTPLFGERADNNLAYLYTNRKATFVGKLLVHNCMLIPLNDHQYREIHANQLVTAATIISPVSSLLNHSCNANVAKCHVIKNNRVQQIYYALQPIKKGSQLFDDYGVNFAYSKKADRDSFCDNYFFKCNCIACNEMWPILEQLPSVLRHVKTKEQQVEVSRAIVRSKRNQRIVFDLDFDGYTGDKKDVLKCLARSITIVSENTSKPSKEYCQLLEQYAQTFARIYAYEFEFAGVLCIN